MNLIRFVWTIWQPITSLWELNTFWKDQLTLNMYNIKQTLPCSIMAVEFRVFWTWAETNLYLLFCFFWIWRMVMACNWLLVWLIFFGACIIEEVPCSGTKWIHSWCFIANCVNWWITANKHKINYKLHVMLNFWLLFELKFPMLFWLFPEKKGCGKTLKSVFFLVCLLSSPTIMCIKLWPRA